MNPNIETNYGYGYRQMDLAVDLLIQNIIKIRHVKDWAQLMGYSRAYFCRIFTVRFGENPKMVLRRARFRKICRIIQSDWSATAYKVAIDAGLQNEKALHKFLKRNFELGFIALKDNLKRNVFRSRNHYLKVAEDELSYIKINLNPLDRSAFPSGLDLK